MRNSMARNRIAGLERDTHLHGTQFNAALAGIGIFVF